jgi:Arc/MetJ-type ribon-helix-helix transcriptional regulator
VAGGRFSSISDLVRRSLRLEKEREWRRKDGNDEEGGGLVALGEFSSIFDLLRQSLGFEKEREWRRRMAMMRKVVAEWPEVDFRSFLIS